MKGSVAIQGFKEKYGKPSRTLLERHRHNNECIAALKRALAEGEKTVLHAAEVAGLPPSEVMWYLNAMKKYGQVVVSGSDGDYKKYALKKD